MATTIELTTAQAQAIHASLGTAQMVYSTNPTTPPEVAQYIYLDARTQGLVFTPRANGGTPLTETALLGAGLTPTPLKVNAVA